MKEAKLLASKEIYSGKVVDLRIDTVRLPNDQTTEMEVVRHRGAAAVVPIDDEGQVILIRQYRHATGGYLYEIPAGKLDGEEPPEDCALRETEEEIGYRPGTLIPMGWIWTAPGFTDEKIWLFLATNLVKTEQNLGDHEVIDVMRIPIENATEMALRDEFNDAKTLCGLLRASHYFGHGSVMGV